MILAQGGRMRCAALKEALYHMEFTRDQVENALTLGKFRSTKDRDGTWWRMLPAGDDGTPHSDSYHLAFTETTNMASKLESMNAAARGDLFHYDPDKLTIIDDPAHPLFDERHDLPIDPEMVQNIKGIGVLEPIIVKKGPVVDGVPQVLVIDGRQRVKHAREANRQLLAEGADEDRLVLVPAIYRRGGEEDSQAVMAAANSYRLVESPTVLGRKLARLANAGRSEAWLCNHFKLTKADLERYIRLVELAPAVQSAVDRGEISIKAIDSLERLPQTKQAEAVEKLVTEGKSGPREAKEAVDAANPEHQPAPKSEKPKSEGPKRRSVKELQTAIDEMEAEAKDAKHEASKKALAIAIAALRYALGDSGETMDLAIAKIPEYCGECGATIE